MGREIIASEVYSPAKVQRLRGAAEGMEAAKSSLKTASGALTVNDYIFGRS
jgi:hypothetical protein